MFSDAGIASIVFYVVTYCFMNLGAFLVVMAVAEKSDGDETIAAFRGLGRRAPIIAAMMALFLFSLTGLPPFAGFVGKFYLFAAAAEGGRRRGTGRSPSSACSTASSRSSITRASSGRCSSRRASAREPTLVRPLFGATSVALAVPTLVLGIYWAPVYDFVARSLTMVR